MRALRFVWLALLPFACRSPEAPPHARHQDISFAESVPLETSLDHAEIPNVADVWIEMIRGAKHTIDLAEFYVSDQPESRLHAVLEEIEKAADRGVHVRLLVDSTFYSKYPEVPDAWSQHANMEMRTLTLLPGVLHAKYFIVDDRDAYLGSQNFDWRSIEHIVEMGVRIDTPNVVAGLLAIFRADWATSRGAVFRLDAMRTTDKLDGGDVTLGASPKHLVPESMWELPRLLTWIGETTGTLRVQLLTYKTKNRDGSEFHELDDALRAAAARGVQVRLLISAWSANDDAVVALSHVQNVEVRALVIPPFSRGDIPFARVSHAKYALFDGGRAWIGTSNWEGDYFYQSRNVSVFLEHVGDIGALERVFVDEWNGQYAHKI